MDSWKEYLENPPFEVRTGRGMGVNPDDKHCVLWRGFEDFDHEELWDFGSGNRWKGRRPPLPSFPDYGGETLCGLDVNSGTNLYGPRWRLGTDTFGQEWGGGGDYITGEQARMVLMDMHGVTCMTCRRKLMYGMCRLIEMLSALRDAVGRDYVENPPLVHGKCVLSSETNDRGIHSEAYRYRCKTAADAINPQLVDDARESEKITCPECIANLDAGTLA